MHKIIANHKQMTNHIFTTGIGTYNTNNANRLGMNIDFIIYWSVCINSPQRNDICPCA